MLGPAADIQRDFSPSLDADVKQIAGDEIIQAAIQNDRAWRRHIGDRR